jgi:hypothetical protein
MLWRDSVVSVKKIQHKYNDRWLDGKAPDSITLKELQ